MCLKPSKDFFKVDLKYLQLDMKSSGFTLDHLGRETQVSGGPGSQVRWELGF